MKISPPAGFTGPFRTDDDARAAYSEGAGIARIIPRAVALPSSPQDVVTLTRWAHEAGIPLVPRGSGSGMAGGAIGDGVIVDLSRMTAMSGVDAGARRIRVGPGALRGAVDAAARARGLRFPVDPSSGAFCTVGGMVATNAAGAHSLAFGATRAWVTALDCVFADGSRAVLRRAAKRGAAPPRAFVLSSLGGAVPALARLAAAAPAIISADAQRSAARPGVRKDSSGYAVTSYAYSGDVIDLIVGSEGTLAIVVGVELALTPVAGASSSLFGAFPSLEQAVLAATRAREAGAVACELLDRTFLEFASSGTAPAAGLARGTEAVLLAEVEGGDAPDADARARALEAMFRDAGADTVALALTPVAEREMWELRHAASPILARLGPSLTSMQFIEDSAVPPEQLAEYVRGVRAAFERFGVRGVIFGHAGDAHVHVNPLIDTSRADWRSTVVGLLAEVVSLTTRLGGTLSGEHGDGRLRTPLLRNVWPAEALRAFEAVKQAMDPLGILNPGVKIAQAGVPAIGDVKYDPGIAPLPPRAAAVLDTVARERAYARCRLDMLDQLAAQGQPDAPAPAATPSAM